MDLFFHIKKYFENVLKEARRIKWPDFVVLSYTIIIISTISLIFAFFLSIEDLAAGVIFRQLEKIFVAIINK